MKKKILHISYLLYLALASACTSDPVPPPEPRARITLTVQSGPTAKAPGESDIRNVSAWLYANQAAYQNGLPAEAFARADGTRLVVDTKQGSKYLVVLANYPDPGFNLSDPLDPDNLRHPIRTETCTLDQMESEGFLMRGLPGQTTIADGRALTVNVVRSIAKVTVEKISNNLTEPGWSGYPVQLSRVFLLNGVGRVIAGIGSSTPGIGDYFNCSARYSPAAGPYPDFGQMEAPALAEASPEVSIPAQGNYTRPITLYTAPNPATASPETSLDALMGADGWTPRRSRLVLECIINGCRCYYPILLPILKENTCYRITEIRLNHFGSDSPDIPVRFVSMMVSAQVTDWDGRTIDETI